MKARGLTAPLIALGLLLAAAGAADAETLQINAGNGKGTITGGSAENPTAIDCQDPSSAPGGLTGTCSASFPNGTSVTLSRSPAYGYEAETWTGYCFAPKAPNSGGGTASTCTLVMNGDKSAGFDYEELPEYSLKINSGNGKGTITGGSSGDPSAINCEDTSDEAGGLTGSCTASFPEGSSVTLSRSPASGYSPETWTGYCFAPEAPNSGGGTASTCTLVMNGDKSAGFDYGLCQLATPGSELGMTLDEACQEVDGVNGAAESNWKAVYPWGGLTCNHYWGSDPESPDLGSLDRETSGGDPHQDPRGNVPNSSYYRITVEDDESDERCELGHNYYLSGENGGIDAEGEGEGTFHLYEQGERAATYLSLKPNPEIASAEAWQTVMQMKQTQPSNNGGPGGQSPILELDLNEGLWQVFSDPFSNPNAPGACWDTALWCFPFDPEAVAEKSDGWVRFLFDVTYSTEPSVASLQVSADLNGDGDFNDTVGGYSERSPRIDGGTSLESSEVECPVLDCSPWWGGNGTGVFKTLRTETAVRADTGTDNTPDEAPWVLDGEPLPSHLRTGIYHNPSAFKCSGLGSLDCSIGIDNIQIFEP